MTEHQETSTFNADLNRTTVPAYEDERKYIPAAEAPSRSAPLPDGLDPRVFLAGERVAPGAYFEVESRREVEFAVEDQLPALHNGRVAAYIRKPPAWGRVLRSRD